MEEIDDTPVQSTIPLRLQEIPQPPKRLYVKGTLPDCSKYKYLTIVGSRRHTSYGRDVIDHLISGLRGYPVVILSGLAQGIDTLAHIAALKNNLKTVAMPGSGLDERVLAPRSNIGLARDIVKAGGALISEYEPNTTAAIWTFPQRNRLMAGLSDAVLLVEAEEKSGTLITARLALDYNRDVMVVPGNIFSACSFGTNKLLLDGAHAVTSSLDILRILGIAPVENAEVISKKSYEDCSEEELAVIKLLTEPKPRDDIIEELGLASQELNSLLTLLELKGHIKEELGQIYKT